MPKKPIMAYLKGSDTCFAEGIAVKSDAPAIEMARKLIQIGIDPDRPMYCFRQGEIAVRMKTLRWAAERGEDGRRIRNSRRRNRRASDAAHETMVVSSVERPEPSRG